MPYTFLSSETKFTEHTRDFPIDWGCHHESWDLWSWGHWHKRLEQGCPFQMTMLCMAAGPGTCFLEKLPEANLFFGSLPLLHRWSEVGCPPSLPDNATGSCLPAGWISKFKSEAGFCHVALPTTTHLKNYLLRFYPQCSLTRLSPSKWCLFNLDIPLGSAARGYKQGTFTTLTQISFSCSATNRDLWPPTWSHNPPYSVFLEVPRDVPMCSRGKMVSAVTQETRPPSLQLHFSHEEAHGCPHEK